jgi:hypothetical protein
MKIRRCIATAGVAGALLLSGTTTAIAQTTTTTAERQRAPRCMAEIDRRIVALDLRQRELIGAEHLTDAHRAALNANIDQTRAGLRTLRAQIANETDPAALKTECDSIWTGYRVFVLVLPRTRLVTVADREVFAAGRLTDAATKLQQAVDAAKAAGQDVAQAQTDLDAMKAKTASGQTTAAGVPDSILDLTPADWNANHDVLKPARTSDKAAHDDLKAAGQLAHHVVTDLKR